MVSTAVINATIATVPKAKRKRNEIAIFPEYGKSTTHVGQQPYAIYKLKERINAAIRARI